MDLTALDYLRAFGLTAFAGLSTGIGGLVVFRKKPINQHLISGALGLSAGVMIYISFVEMLSGSFDTLNGVYGANGNLFAVLAFFGGILLSMLIDFIIPQERNPHEMLGMDEVSYDPHAGAQPEAAGDSVVVRYNGKRRKELARVGLISAFAIMAHNLPEGLATFVGALKDPALGISIAVAVAIHNIPEGIAVAVPLYAGTGNKKRAFLMALFSGLAEPVGALLGFLIFRPFLSDALMGIIFAAVAGIMVYISLDELLPSAEKQGEHHIVIAGLILGMAIMAISLLIL
ncbi:MAG: zinc transporter ZupT [Eubacteriales bacterium]|jgi:ZIP family zinc transporter|nr:zinc transporter ZupT [Eubacteriales bacterium]NLO13817.1 zinc transporter ZupT [Clostridiales bacterium]